MAEGADRDRNVVWAELVAAVSAAGDPGETVDAVVRSAPAVFGAAHVVVIVAGEHEVVEVHGWPRRPRLQIAGAAAAWIPSREVLERGAAVLLPDRDSATRRFPSVVAAWSEVGVHASLTVPVMDPSGRCLGAIEVLWTEPRPFDAEMESRVCAVAALLGRALVAAQMDRQARSAGALAALARALVGLPSRENIAAVIASLGRDVVGALSANVAIPDAEGSRLLVLHHQNLEASARRRFASQDVDQRLPLTDAYRSGEPVLLSSLEELELHYPAIFAALRDAGRQAVAALPVPDPLGRTSAVLGFAWNQPQVFDEHLRATLLTVASLGGQALHHATAVERERRAAAEARSAEMVAARARSEADTARQRLLLLAEVAARAGRALDLFQVAHDLSDTLVGHFSDSCAVYLTGPEGLERVSVAKAGTEIPEDRIVVAPDSTVPVAVAYRTGRAHLRPLTPELLDDYGVSGAVRDADSRQPTHTVLAVPVVVAAEVVAVLQFGAAGDRPAFDAEDVVFATDIAERAARPIENALRYRNEHLMAESLREAILPERSLRLRGLRIETFYRPAAARAGVGGDWYDAFEVDGRCVIVLGDVMGKGITAAKVMTEVRNAIRAYALSDPDPAAVLSRLRRYVENYISDTLVTLAYVLVDPRTGEASVSHAGHPPALHLSAGREPQWLAGQGPLLAALIAPGREEVATVTLAPHERLLLYSDGLVESRRLPLGQGLAKLAASVQAAPNETLDTLVAAVDPAADDDISIISVELSAGP